MKKVVFLLFVAIIMTTAFARDWQSQVGLPQGCTNPVFTRPDNMNPEGRVRGAGICMNDGEAYTNRFVSFSSEWHYAPKLHLCEEEKKALPRVMGIFVSERDETRSFEPLKFCVRVHHGCGAVVVYRAFDNYRYTNIKSDNLEQFIAVYDDEGRLTDAMMMGYIGDTRDVLLVEPHKDYQVPSNMGNHNLQFDETGEHFTISRYWYLKDEADGLPDKVEMKRYYTITPQGKIHLDKVTNGSEAYEEGSGLKPGALINEVANPAAVDMMEMMLTPMSDPQVLSRLDKVYAKLNNDKQVGERLMHLGMMVYNRDPKVFLSYVYKNRAKTSLIKLLKNAFSYTGPGMEYKVCLDETIAFSGLPAKTRKWIYTKLQ
ncbi:MAG: hypothetical protein IKX31_08195 [Muribaculaceae bacterium]|nr:hypothetical protein [Muribaculaceae bacterium]